MAAPLNDEMFGAYVRAAAQRAGYDLTSPRSGGRLALAKAAGMSHPSVSRMLSDQTIPNAEYFQGLADALNVPVAELFEVSGIVTPGVLTKPQPPAPGPLAPADAAALLGLRDKRSVALFTALVATLLDHEATE